MEKSIIKFSKTRTVKLPSRGHDTDAGIDFYVPQFDTLFIQDLHEKNNNLLYIAYDEELKKQYILLESQDRINIPSGIHCNMGNDRALIAFNKSGVATKYGLLLGACLVDSSYQGEIHLSVINTSNTDVRIYEDQKLTQFVELPIYLSEIIDVSKDELYSETSTRGAGAFGSTDYK
jgi:dUTPase